MRTVFVFPVSKKKSLFQIFVSFDHRRPASTIKMVAWNTCDFSEKPALLCQQNTYSTAVADETHEYHKLQKYGKK